LVSSGSRSRSQCTFSPFCPRADIRVFYVFAAVTFVAYRGRALVHIIHITSSDLISPLGKLADRAIYFTFRNFFFFLNRPNISQHLLGRFSRSFYHMKGICVKFLDPDLFFQFLKGRCHGNRFWQNLLNDLYSTRRRFETDSIIAISI